MNKRQDLQTRSVREGIGTLNALSKTPELAELCRQRDALADSLRTIDELFQRQYMAGKATKAPRPLADQARRDIRTRHLIPVSRRAKRVFRNDSTILRALEVPPSRATLEEHAAAALAMAKALRPHAKLCHAEGFRPGFIADLKAAGTQLRAQTTLGAAARREMSAVTRQLKEAIRDARELAGILDVEVAATNHTHPNLKVGGEWFSVIADLWSKAYKLGKTIGRPKTPRKRRVTAAPGRALSPT